jgi:two-component system, NarL family, response regulator NreC
VEDVATRVICANQAPDHTTIARFGHRHETALAEVFGAVLAQVSDDVRDHPVARAPGRTGASACRRTAVTIAQNRGDRVLTVTDTADVASKAIAIVLADDHAMVRGGLRLLLEAEEDLHFVAEAGDIETALHHVGAHRPHVVVLDLNMPGSPTLPALPRFLTAAPDAAVVVMKMADDLNLARQALAAGASAYVLKTGAGTELLEAVRSAAVGRTYLDPALGARLAQTPPGPGSPGAVSGRPEWELEIGATFAGHRIDSVIGRAAWPRYCAQPT